MAHRVNNFFEFKPIRIPVVSEQKGTLANEIVSTMRQRAEIFEHYIIHKDKIFEMMKAVSDKRKYVRSLERKKQLLEQEDELLDMLTSLNNYTELKLNELSPYRCQASF